MIDLITKYLVSQKKSKTYKNLILSSIKHASEMNDIILNWKKLKKFINSEKSGNEINGKDRAYTHEEIQKLTNFCEQRIKTAFLILASTGIRSGVLRSLRIRDLKKIDDIYRITVYPGDNEEYFTFCTPETAKEIDTYLEFRKRHGEKIIGESYLIVKKFNVSLNEQIRGRQFRKNSLQALLDDNIIKCGLRETNHVHQFKRKEVPRLHGFRKFFTKQLVDSRINPEIREMLLGHKIGLASAYYKPTEQEMYQEYLKAIELLTIGSERRLQTKITNLVEKSTVDVKSLKSEIQNKEAEVAILKDKEFSNSDAIAALSEKVMELTKEIDELKKNRLAFDSI
jgi:integrase